jgi:hypothetical protein
MKQMLEFEEDPQPSKQERRTKKSTKKWRPVYSANKKEKRNKTEARKNMYHSLVKIMMNEKNRTMVASLRDNRKPKNQEIV